MSSARSFAASIIPNVTSVQQLDAWIAGARGMFEIDVPEDRWQIIRTEQERLAAERKLDGWLVKPTDGNFARFNRRISIPISRQLIRLPITPNMVSLFTLGVSFLAGLFFALGGYSNMVMGAILGLFASILDGCDGEVARLKLQETEFGCWLETVCDYLYYLFMFAGMTIGLLRSSGSRVFLYVGCLLLVGAILSFVTTAMQRVRLTSAGRPEQLLGNWQREAARRGSNPFVYMARHTEFIVRRCFLPYAILFFAVFRIVPVAFVLAAVGANVVWVMALYSYLTFPAARA
jgi:phosphatidylglycerophosphate synthase